MTVSDTSSNGTFINNNRMLKGTSVPVTPKDNLRLGSNWKFDWSLVNDPYRTTRRIIITVICLLFLSGVGLGVWYYISENQSSTNDTVEIPKDVDSQKETEWNSDSTKKVAPTVESITPQKAVKSKSNRKKNRARTVNNIKKHSIPKEKVIVKDTKEKDMPLVIN